MNSIISTVELLVILGMTSSDDFYDLARSTFAASTSVLQSAITHSSLSRRHQQLLRGMLSSTMWADPTKTPATRWYIVLHIASASPSSTYFFLFNNCPVVSCAAFHVAWLSAWISPASSHVPIFLAFFLFLLNFNVNVVPAKPRWNARAERRSFAYRSLRLPPVCVVSTVHIFG